MEHFRKITIASRNQRHFTEVFKKEDGGYKLSGMEGNILAIILEKLALPYEIILPTDDAFGAKGPDGNWTGVLGLVYRDEADMAYGSLGQAYQWLEFADFSDTLYTDSITFAMRKPQKLPKANDFLRVFKLTMWLSLIFTLVLFPPIYYFFLDKKYTIANLFFQMSASVMKQPMDFKIQSLKHRFVIGSWLMFALIISFCYTQVLLSHSTIPSESKVYKNFVELYDAVKKGDIRCYFLNISIFDALFQNTPEAHVKALGEIITRNRWYVERSVDAYVDLINEGQAIISANFFPKFTYADSFEEEIFMSDDSLLLSSVSVVLNKKFCCRKRLNQIINRISYAGLLHREINMKSFLLHLKFRKKQVQFEAAPPIAINKLYGVFLILLVGYLVSFFAFIVEVLTFRINSVKDKNESM